MGYEPGIAPEPVTILTGEVSDELRLMGDIRAEYRIISDIRFDHEEKSVGVGDIIFAVMPVVYRQIKDAEEVALFICTAGPVIGERSRQSMKEGDLLRGYIYDVIGSEVVEAAADRMQEELRAAAAARGKMITNRFSPGYCGWDVAEQHKLFGFFKDNFCGITLTESALMNPVKSVSGIIGIGRNVKYAPYQCHVCDDKNCIYRNRKRQV
jgi:cobalamin-dependent methionine synthase I